MTETYNKYLTYMKDNNCKDLMNLYKSERLDLEQFSRIAIEGECLEVLQFLIDNNLKINNNLKYAIEMNSFLCCQMLCENDANVSDAEMSICKDETIRNLLKKYYVKSPTFYEKIMNFFNENDILLTLLDYIKVNNVVDFISLHRKTNIDLNGHIYKLLLQYQYHSQTLLNISIFLKM